MPTRLNPDQVDFDSAIAEMRAEKLSDDDIHKEIASEFGSTIADQHLKRGVFAPKEETGIWPKEWSRIPEQVPWEIPAALAATGAAIVAAKSEKGQQAIESAQRGFSSLKNRMFGPSQPDMPGTALNQAAVADGALPSQSLASSPQTPMGEASSVQEPTPEQIRIQKQRAAQAMMEGRPVVAGAGPVTTSTAQDLQDIFNKRVAEAVPTNPTGIDVTTEVGNRPKDMPLVNRSDYNKGANEFYAEEKNLTKQGAVSPSRRTTEQAAIAKLETDIPEGRISNYMEFKKKKNGSVEYKNKQGSDVIGKGGWNWYQGQMGPEAEQQWLRQFGRTNQTYADVKQAIKEGRLQGPEVVEGRGGSFKRETTVPEYIRGSAPIESMARSALAAFGILPVAQKIKQGDYKGALNEAIPASAMIAPALSLAASPLYTSEEEKDVLKAMKQKGFKSFKEFEDYKQQVGGGRGVAPPSAYQR